MSYVDYEEERHRELLALLEQAVSILSSIHELLVDAKDKA